MQERRPAWQDVDLFEFMCALRLLRAPLPVCSICMSILLGFVQQMLLAAHTGFWLWGLIFS